MDAVVFSTFCKFPRDIPVCRFYLDCLVENFSDCDIYVGVNASCNEWLDTLELYKSKLSMVYAITDKDKEIDSDASAYQTALRLLKESGKEYKNILLTHTKGVTYNRPDIGTVLRGYKNQFLSREAREEATLKLSGGVYGCVSDHCAKTYGELVNALDYFYTFPFTANNIFPVDSMYYMRGDIVHKFIHACTSSFFDKNLLDCGCDRYFFERDFPTLCYRFGYELSVKAFMCHPLDNYFDESLFNVIVSNWRLEN